MEDIPSPFEIDLDPNDGYLTPRFFQSIGLSGDFIIDVGVSRGTPWLYQSFPDSDFLLVDPLPGFQEHLIRPPKSYTCENVGLGSARARLTLDLRGPRSSLHEWRKNRNHSFSRAINVEIRTLDELISKHAPNRTIGIKVDTEGHEVEVILGLNNYVENIEFIICECSIRKRFEDDYWFSELIQVMAERGFELYNLLSHQKPRPVHYDCLFLRRGSRWFGLGGVSQPP